MSQASNQAGAQNSLEDNEGGMVVEEEEDRTRYVDGDSRLAIHDNGFNTLITSNSMAITFDSIETSNNWMYFYTDNHPTVSFTTRDIEIPESIVSKLKDLSERGGQ